MASIDIPPDEYDALYQTDLDRAEEAWVARHLSALPRPLLDVGCGTGLAARLLPTLDRGEFTGVDMDPRMVEFARIRHPHLRWVNADLGLWSGRGDRFAAMSALFLPLDDFAPPPQTFETVRRLHLLPGAPVFMVVYGRVWSRRSPSLPDRIGHTPAEVAAILEGAGYSEVDAYALRTSGVLPLPIPTLAPDIDLVDLLDADVAANRWNREALSYFTVATARA